MRLAALVAAALVVSCAELPEVDLRVARSVGDGAVVLHLPIDMLPVEIQGIDSEIGMFRRDGLELTYDFGVFSDNLLHPPEGAEVEDVTLVERACRVVTYTLVDDPGWTRAVSAHVPDVDSKGPGDQPRHLTLRFRCADDEQVAVARAIIDDVEVP